MEKKYFALYLLPNRPDFAQTMNEEELAIMKSHVIYWTDLMNKGKVIAFGPVMDPKSVYGLGIIIAENENEVEKFISSDPASKINRYEYFPMRAMVP